MSPDLEKIQAQVLKLSLSDRAQLAEHLLASLDTVDDTENERLWVKEAEHRYQEYKRGNIESRPAEDVMRDARSTIK